MSFAEELRARAITKGTPAVLAGSAASGLAAYAFQVLGTRGLGDTAYAPVGVLWTIQYLVFSVALMSIEAYVTRGVTLRHRVRDAVLWRWVGGLAVVVGLVTGIARRPLFDSADLAWPLAAAVVVLAFGGFVLARGHLAGQGRFTAYGAATGFESGLRLLVAAAVVALLPGPLALGLTLPVGAATVAVWWGLWGRHRAPAELPALPPPAPGVVLPPHEPTGVYLAATVFANAACQTLLASGPLVVTALGAGASATSVVFVTVTAARAPLVFAFGGLLSRVLPPLTRLARAGDAGRVTRIAARIAGIAGGIAAAAAVAGALLGPPLVAAFFGAEFRPSAAFGALTGAGVVLATASLLLNQVLIAMGAERRLMVPWAVALAAGVAAVGAVGTADAAVAVGTGTVLGQSVALVGLVLAVRRPVEAPAPERPEERTTTP